MAFAGSNTMTTYKLVARHMEILAANSFLADS